MTITPAFSPDGFPKDVKNILLFAYNRRTFHISVLSLCTKAWTIE